MTMPERVWIHPTSHAVYSRVYEGPPSVPYVPESRLREVEAEVRRLEVLVRNTEVDTNGAPVTVLNALRADLAALVPLAVFTLGLYESQDYPGPEITDEQITRARAVLEREGT